jgi:hypothetical protein
MTHTNDNGIELLDRFGTPFSEELRYVHFDYETTRYKTDRKYPPIGDQLDALFKAGVFPDEMAALIQAVKDANPKPDFDS